MALAVLGLRRRCRLGGRRRWPGRQVAVDDVLPLAQRGAARRRDQVIDGHETQLPAAAGLDGHIRDARGPRHLVADAQGAEEFQLAARPHPARQRHRRQKTAAGGMAVGSEFRHRINRLRQAPMHGPGRGIAGLRLADLHEQRGAQALHQLRGDGVGGLVAAPDPLAQMVDIEPFSELFRHDDLIRTGGGSATLVRSPIAGTAP